MYKCNAMTLLTVRLPLTLRFCFESRFYKMFFNSIFRNVNVTLLCITNAPTIMYAASPEKWSFHSGGGGDGGGGGAPFIWIFWIRPCIENDPFRGASYWKESAHPKWSLPTSKIYGCALKCRVIVSQILKFLHFTHSVTSKTLSDFCFTLYFTYELISFYL